MIGGFVGTVWITCDGPSCRERACGHGTDLEDAIGQPRHEGWGVWPALGVAVCNSCTVFTHGDIIEVQAARMRYAAVDVYGRWLLPTPTTSTLAAMAKLADWLDVNAESVRPLEEWMRVEAHVGALGLAITRERGDLGARAAAFSRAIARWRAADARRTPGPFRAS